MKKKKLYLTGAALCLFLFLSVFPLVHRHEDRISTGSHRGCDIIVLLGATVYPGGRLSPVVRQRCDALLKIYFFSKENQKPVLISSSNSYEVNHLTEYLVGRGIPGTMIIRDPGGFTTGRTIQWLQRSGYINPLLVTQSFHLHRALEMATDGGLNARGVAAEKLAPLAEKISSAKKYFIRLKRYYRSAVLLLLHETGLYEPLSRFEDRKV